MWGVGVYNFVNVNLKLVYLLWLDVEEVAEDVVSLLLFPFLFAGLVECHCHLVIVM